MTWVQRGEEWHRSDGVQVKPDTGSVLNSFRVVDQTGAPMMHPHAHRSSVIRRFKTYEGAMRSADRHWPLRGS